MSSNRTAQFRAPDSSGRELYPQAARRSAPSSNSTYASRANTKFSRNVANSSRSTHSNAASPAIAPGAARRGRSHFPSTTAAARGTNTTSAADKSDYQIIKEGGWDNKKDFMLCHGLWKDQSPEEFEEARELLDAYRQVDVERERQSRRGEQQRYEADRYHSRDILGDKRTYGLCFDDSRASHRGFTDQYTNAEYHWNDQTPPRSGRNDFSFGTDGTRNCTQRFEEDECTPPYHEGQGYGEDDSPEQYYSEGHDFDDGAPGLNDCPGCHRSPRNNYGPGPNNSPEFDGPGCNFGPRFDDGSDFEGCSRSDYGGCDPWYGGYDDGYEGYDGGYYGYDDGYDGCNDGYGGCDDGYGGCDDGYGGCDDDYGGCDDYYGDYDDDYGSGDKEYY